MPTVVYQITVSIKSVLSCMNKLFSVFPMINMPLISWIQALRIKEIHRIIVHIGIEVESTS